MEKSPDAFRTISEVAEWLEVPAHVLRFWESRFSQVRPVKRAGGRRYYRPADMALLDGIRKLLHDDGMTIRGVQALLREKGTKSVAALARPMDFGAQAAAKPPAESASSDRPPRADSAAGTTAPTPAPAPEREEVPEAPMAEDVPLDDSAAGDDKVVHFAPATRPAAEPPDDEPDLPFDTPAEPAAKAPPAPAAAEPDAEAPPAPAPADTPAAAPRAPAAVQIPDDPADDDPAFAVLPRDRASLAAVDPGQLRPLRDRLAAVRRRLGDAPRRPPPG